MSTARPAFPIAALSPRGILALLFTALFGSASAQEAEFFGPAPYLSAADTPSGFADEPTVIENFEDGVADPRVSVVGSIIGPGGLTDSVDADDGVIDGSGTQGHSLFGGSSSVSFEEPFPISAGIVWTDAGPGATITFEAFGPDDVSLGTIVATGIADDSNVGTTAEDRFFGVKDAGGIRRISLSQSSGGIETDHVQFTNMLLSEPAILSTLDDGDFGVLVPDPGALQTLPAQTAFALPAGVSPHGVAFARGGSEAVFSDFLTPTLYFSRLLDVGAVSSLTLPGRSVAGGTLAASPYGRYLLSLGRAGNGNPESVVVDLQQVPPTITPIVPTLDVPQFNTAAVDFAPDGRAFVCHAGGVSVLSPPYITVDFTMSFPAIQQSGSQCRLSRDGARLFVTRVLSETVPTINGVHTTAAPYSAGSAFVTMPAPKDVQGLGPMAVSPDGQALLVGQQFLFPQAPIPPRARLFLLRAPFDNLTTYQEIALPADVSGENCIDSASTFDCPGFEHIEVNFNGSLAILTGNSNNALPNFADRVPAVFVRMPFASSSRTVFAVPIAPGPSGTEGRGSGGARFQPIGIFQDGFE